MLQGAWTAEAARAISNEFDAQGLDVFCAHRNRRSRKDECSHVKTGRIISWGSPYFEAWAQLAFPDIAIVDRKTNKVILLAEIEENKPQPKLVIADTLASLLGDRLTFGPDRKELILGSWTTFCLLARSTGKGYGEEQLSMLHKKLNEANGKLFTPNNCVKTIIIDTYRSETELLEKLANQTKIALREQSTVM